MTWLGLRDRRDSVFAAPGLSHPTGAAPDLTAPVAQGTLLIETAMRPGEGRQVLLRFSAADSARRGLELALDDAGDLHLCHWHDEQRRLTRLSTGHMARAEELLITYTWDKTDGLAQLSAAIGDTGHSVATTALSPLLPTQDDLRRIVADHAHAVTGPALRFLAVADHQIPHGPLPGLSGATLIQTPNGQRPLSSLRIGQEVSTEDGCRAQVRWIGSAEFPARGQFSPVCLPAPYHGATRDLMASRTARVHVAGSTVDYLYATPMVSVRAADLGGALAARMPEGHLTVPYWGFVLDRPVAALSGGLRIEPLDCAAIAQLGIGKANTVLHGLPDELLPTTPARVPRLYGAEAQAMGRLRAA